MERACIRFARFAALIPIVATALWSADPEIGTWRLNVQKSRFLPGPAFQSETRTYEENHLPVAVGL